ncbi:MAG: amidohydrolase family protein, partial [Clostridia bacterium]|nr:amidohydrolase family protein [Clostridia bacterium]
MKKLLLKNANVITGEKDGTLQKGQSLLIENGVIKEIGAELVAEDAQVIDLNGSYVLPGLINLHVHLPASGKPSKTKVSNKKKLVSLLTKNKLLHGIGVSMGAKYAEMELLSGVTTLRAVGGVANFDAVLRDKINAGKKLGPRILAANTAVGVPNG